MKIVPVIDGNNRALPADSISMDLGFHKMNLRSVWAVIHSAPQRLHLIIADGKRAEHHASELQCPVYFSQSSIGIWNMLEHIKRDETVVSLVVERQFLQIFISENAKNCA